MKDSKIIIRVEPQIKKKFKLLAKSKGRSMTNMISYLIETKIKEEEKNLNSQDDN